MPVWHAETKELVASGKLAVIGIVQEQHRERAALYAQWQGLDWPILWDPFNQTEAKVVLNSYLVEPGGKVVKSGVRASDLEAFLKREFGVAEAAAPKEDSEEAPRGYRALELLPHEREGDRQELAELVDAMIVHAGRSAVFQRGVLARMVFDADPEAFGALRSFERAAGLWQFAIRDYDAQYIWRRRLQQYGPQLDKPYPFYDWVDTARTEILARGDVPVKLHAPLTPTERLGRRPVTDTSNVEPDPKRALPEDDEGFAFEVSFVYDTVGRPKLCAHLSFVPSARHDAHWNDEAGPLVVWLDAVEGVTPQRRLEFVASGNADDTERRTLSVDLDDVPEAKLTGYAVIESCRADVCSRVRRPFRFEVPGRNGR